MPKIIDGQTDIAFRGPLAAELAFLAQDGSWTKHRVNMLAMVVRTLKLSGYQTFNGSGQTIGLYRKGHSAVFAVPAAQKRALAPFAGKLAHAICIDRTDSYSGRSYAVAEVTPEGDRPTPSRTSGQPYLRLVARGGVRMQAQIVRHG